MNKLATESQPLKSTVCMQVKPWKVLFELFLITNYNQVYITKVSY